ncbi:MBL fold metallo-hydrolase [Cellulophaga baltica]|uniref:MBL fold metallo-hydrolase n=1 Tax=Cellulophaga TaxID=104264 RepID=UPI001C06E0C8|nr:MULTISPECIES: MBL fold metallo-hydrolase [Cellulophaga]MBU2996113.1 MBL fold metallo-hydrolase [Cellulophaga baltica]MDO6767508.1 MBL fold metallo-hydrolase [Cellulophaga sp. 1_MG-2023]
MKKLIPFIAFGVLLIGCKEGKKKKAETMKEEVVKTAEEMPEEEAEFQITPIEHASAVFQWGETTIYLDPVGGAEAYKAQKKPDLILITDIHGDHLNVETLDSLDTSNATFIVPQAVAEKLPESYASKLSILNNDDIKVIHGLTITAKPMYNLREEALKFHTKGRGNGYILEKDEQRVYISGDTEDIPEMRALKNIDIAFICMNLPYTMTEENAASAVIEFKPKKVYPYHYRGKPDVSDVAKFKKLVNEGDPEIEVIQLDWYPNEEY